MAKPRTCPHCRSQMPIGHGYHFDDQDNLICDACDKVAYPAVEAEVKSNRQHHWPGGVPLPLPIDPCNCDEYQP